MRRAAAAGIAVVGLAFGVAIAHAALKPSPHAANVRPSTPSERAAALAAAAPAQQVAAASPVAAAQAPQAQAALDPQAAPRPIADTATAAPAPNAAPEAAAPSTGAQADGAHGDEEAAPAQPQIIVIEQVAAPGYAPVYHHATRCRHCGRDEPGFTVTPNERDTGSSHRPITTRGGGPPSVPMHDSPRPRVPARPKA